MYNWRNYIKINFTPENEYEYLSSLGIKIINTLRTETLDLNLNQHVRIHHKEYRKQYKKQNGHIQFMKCDQKCCVINNSGRCAYDNKIETVNHVIMKCTQYTIIRNEMMNVIQPYYHYYGYQINLKTLLFVPKYYNYNQKRHKLRWQHRKLIYGALITYVMNLNRFNWFK